MQWQNTTSRRQGSGFPGRSKPPHQILCRVSQLHAYSRNPGPQNTQSQTDDLRLDLWRVLVAMGGSKAAQAFEEASNLTTANAARLRRLIEPPPAGYPPGPSGDQVVSLLAGPLDFLDNIHQTYGPVAGLLLGGERVVVVTGGDAAYDVMIGQSDVFIKKGTAFFPGSSLAGNGLLVSDGDVWKRQRRLSNPAFRRAAVETYAGAMMSATYHMLDNVWQPGSTRDVYADFNSLTLDITLEALFGCTLEAKATSSGQHTSEPPANSNQSSARQHSNRSLSLQPSHDSQAHVADNDVVASQSRHSTSSVRQQEYESSANGQARSISNSGTATLERDVGSMAGPSYSQTLHLQQTNRQASVSMSIPSSNSSSSSSSSSRSMMQSSADAQAIITAVAKAFEFFTRRAGAAMLLPEWLPTWDNLEFGAAVAQLDKVVYGIIRERRQLLAEQGQSSTSIMKQDLLQGLLSAVDEDGSGMSDVSLRDELMTLLIAGQETSAILLGWACALLAKHPDIQEQVAAEVATVIGNRQPTAADTRQLPLLEACVLEALRLYAPAYLVGRCACTGTQLGQYDIPAGTTILISPYVMHRDAAVWGDDAQEFKPSRWSYWLQQPGYGGFLSLLNSLGPHKHYLPFGAGPRNCIGTGFAMMEAILVLAAVIQRFELQPGAATFPTATPQITLRPAAVPLRLVTRL